MSIKQKYQVRTLLWKDWLILRRNWMFLVMLIVVPIMMMTAFWYIETALDATFLEERQNLNQTRYGKVDFKSKQSFIGSDMKSKGMTHRNREVNVTAMVGCQHRKEVGLVAPKELTYGFEEILKTELRKSGRINLHIFDTVDALFEDISLNKTKKYCFAFQLSHISPKVEEVNITIFFPRDDIGGLINTYTPIYDLTLASPDWLAYNKTMLYGTNHFMIAITDFVAMMVGGHRMKEIELAWIPMKTPAFKEFPPSSAAQLQAIFPIFFMCVFLLPLYYLVTRLSEEKESKAREGMKMMGLSDETYYKSWFAFNGCLTIGTSLLIVGVLQVELFQNSNKLLMLAMCCTYGSQLFGFSFSIVAFFTSKKASATAASILHLSTYYIVYVYSTFGSSVVQKVLVACLMPNCALGFMLEHLLHCELEGGSPLTLQTAFMPYRSFNFIYGVSCQVVCSFLWACLGMYFDKIMPSEFGKAEPWNFICKRKQDQRVRALGEEQHDSKLSDNFERESDVFRQRDQLKIRGLKKRYSGGYLAVESVDMTMYKGQIFALLGHNGAGKTTTISMLTGLIEPTEGSATVDGYDIFESMDRLRENLGVCPQHNVLFDSLSVREHLELFCALKGKSQFEVFRRVDKMIRDVELEDVQFQLASTLSGGQKRKLSVGIALIGDAKIVMLDEPTSGMDTTTRRRFWEMIKQYKEDRIIILTTHYMDEADVLGDRICIMAEGKVQCCGSALFLKSRFGVGYNLKLTKTQKTNSSEVEKYIGSRLKDAKHLQDLQSEIIYQLPEESRSQFKQFFTNLDKDLNKLNIQSYGMSITTLEEVFLKIGHGEDTANTIDSIKLKTADLSKLSDRERQLTEYSIAKDNHKSFVAELKTLALKKLLVQVRDFRSCVMDILLPCVMIVGGIYISKLQLVPQGHPARNLSLYEFPSQPFVHNQANFIQDEFQDYLELGFKSDMGTIWTEDVPLSINISSHFFEQISEVDEYLFNTRNESGPYFAQMFIQNADREGRNYSIASLVNVSQPHSTLAATSYMLQSILRSELERPEFRLNFFEAQLPFAMDWQIYINTGTSLLSSLGFAIAYMMLSDTLIQSLLKEKQLAIKHQIIISGGSKIAYWLSHYLVDTITHAIPAVLTCICIVYFEVDCPEIEVLFFWFCLTNPLFIYTVQFVMKNDSQASIIIRVFYFAFGGVAPIAMQVLTVVNKETLEIAQYLKRYFIFVPVYNINFGFISITNRNILELLNKLTKGSLQPYDQQCAGESLYMLQLAALCCFVILVCVENNVYQVFVRPVIKPIQTHLEMIHESTHVKKVRKVYGIQQLSQLDDFDFSKKVYVEKIEDQDPNQEEIRVQGLDHYSIKVQGLTKAYTPFTKAVDNLSFALNPGDCFALLGITGAGKTTTFKCLTQEEIPDEGTLMMAGHNVRSQLGFSQARQMIGYCPQFDAIYEHLTVKEHLNFYATIKGVRPDYKNELVMRQMKELDLANYENVLAGKLSGGNKRKLSCAIALIGNPPIVLLDEPSTGVDPQAKRFMWTVISNISTLRKQSTVILTTHSMEEAEALCPKMGIMVDGKFQCFGSAQHIKDKYADGFDIDLKITELTIEQVDSLLKRLELTNETYVNESDAKQILERLDFDLAFKNVTRENNLKKILRQESPFQLLDVMRWAYVEYKGLSLIANLERVFGQCEIIEHYSNRYNLKVNRNHHSIGFVFGLMEDMMQEFSIKEYQATQTTLEQIFNMFAKQKGVKDRHESQLN